MNSIVSVASLSSATAIASPYTSGPDPIFAAIDQEAELNNMQRTAGDRAADIREALRFSEWEWAVYSPVPPKNCKIDPRLLAAELEYGALSRAHGRAMVALVSTKPTTNGGMKAFFQYLSTRLKANDEFLGEWWIGEYDANGEAIYLNLGRKLIETLGGVTLSRGDDASLAKLTTTDDHEPEQSEDPIFAAIRTHQQVNETMIAFGRAHDAAENLLTHAKARGKGIVAAKRRERTANKKFMTVLAKESEALYALCRTTPTTFVGAIALLEYLEPRVSNLEALMHMPQDAIQCVLQNIYRGILPIARPLIEAAIASDNASSRT